MIVQRQLMNELCQCRYEQETTEQEYHFLKQQIAHYNSSCQSFSSSPIAHSPVLDSIQNPQLRQRLVQQYREVAEQARANIFALYTATAEEQKDEYKKKSNACREKMWTAYRSSADRNERIDSTMLGLIHQRCEKISERIRCVYKFKHQSLMKKSA
jgi:hypothetical protein